MFVETLRVNDCDSTANNDGGRALRGHVLGGISPPSGSAPLRGEFSVSCCVGRARGTELAQSAV